jgi:CYTH domain-containing protein
MIVRNIQNQTVSIAVSSGEIYPFIFGLSQVPDSVEVDDFVGESENLEIIPLETLRSGSITSLKKWIGSGDITQDAKAEILGLSPKPAVKRFLEGIGNG